MCQTIADVRKLIKKSKGVYVRPFFGTMEHWVKISKPEAYEMFKIYDGKKTLLECNDYDMSLQLDCYKFLYLG